MLRVFYILLFYLLLVVPSVFAQQKDTSDDRRAKARYYTVEPDGALCIHLQDVVIKNNPLNSKKNRRKIPRKYRKGTRAYNRTIRNIKTMYPLAKKIAKMIKKIEKDLEHIEDKKEKKAFIKREYKKIMKVHKEPMKKLKISQGRMLIVLIHRETGNTSYEHIKHFKGGFTAFFWQGIAKLFGNDLKKGYEPEGEHIYLEYLIQRYEKGQL